MQDNLSIHLPHLNIELVMQAMSEVYDWGLRDLSIPEVHKQTMGENVTVGIIDSGKSEHFETLPATVDWSNFSSSSVTEDRYGHSSFVAGIIAAAKNNQGIIGVAPKCKLIFAKSMDSSGRGSPSSMVNAVLWLIQKKVDIISISAGMFVDFKPLHRSIKLAYSKNIIIIASAGNSGTQYYDVAFPARYPEVIGVAAYDRKHKIARFSSRGINVSYAMPGVDIYSTHLNNSFVKESGTSFSCPILSGLCALILSQHRKTKNPITPCETPKQMMEHLQKYAIRLGDKREAGYGYLNVKGLFSFGD